MHQNTSYGIIL